MSSRCGSADWSAARVLDEPEGPFWGHRLILSDTLDGRQYAVGETKGGVGRGTLEVSDGVLPDPDLYRCAQSRGWIIHNIKLSGTEKLMQMPPNSSR